MSFSKLTACRICGNSHLVKILDLGDQMLTGIFPKSKGLPQPTIGPLELVKCSGGDEFCGLVQLNHSFNLSEMYGLNYGYRSGLNQSMVTHLSEKVEKALSLAPLKKGDLVIDIGSNDCTTLKAYPEQEILRVGIDPTGIKFASFYPKNINLIPDFFSEELVTKLYPNKKAKIITSFSMFYDLEDPMDFMRQIHKVLDNDGIWIFEQSYMPEMLSTNSFDTVCHEHLEFYALEQIQFMCKRVGFKIIDVEFNDVNGGSFSITVKKSSNEQQLSAHVSSILNSEKQAGLNTLSPYSEFSKRIEVLKDNFQDFIKSETKKGKKIGALGASTKGNVLLQYYGLSALDIVAIGEVNSEKFGCFTPGTWIPIVPEDELLKENLDYLIVLPWHFKKFFMDNKKFVNQTLIFPLPKLCIYKNGELQAL